MSSIFERVPIRGAYVLDGDNVLVVCLPCFCDTDPREVVAMADEPGTCERCGKRMGRTLMPRQRAEINDVLREYFHER